MQVLSVRISFIDNIVKANILAVTHHCEESRRGDEAISKTFHEIFNVANGKDNTVLQLVDSLNKITGKNIKPEFLPLRPGDVFRTLADISKTRAFLGYEPKVSFEEGLRRTVDWFKRQ